MIARRVTPRYHCVRCDALTIHAHIHDTAYGIPNTHHHGSERYVCERCYKTTSINDPNARNFPFFFDKQQDNE